MTDDIEVVVTAADSILANKCVPAAAIFAENEDHIADMRRRAAVHIATARLASTKALERLTTALAKVSPIETRETADYAELCFGDHQTQAMTMCPNDWNDIEAAYIDARAALAGDTQ